MLDGVATAYTVNNLNQYTQVGTTTYSYDLDGDDSFEITNSDSAKPSFTYNTAGSFTAKVKVKDSEGLESAPKTLVITAVPLADPATAKGADHATRADFVLFTRTPVKEPAKAPAK